MALSVPLSPSLVNWTPVTRRSAGPKPSSSPRFLHLPHRRWGSPKVRVVPGLRGLVQRDTWGLQGRSARCAELRSGTLLGTGQEMGTACGDGGSPEPTCCLGRPNDSSGCWSAVRSWGSVGTCCLVGAELSGAQPCLSRFQLVHSPPQSGAVAGSAAQPAPSLPLLAAGPGAASLPAGEPAAAVPAPGAHRTARPGPGAAVSVSPRPERSGRALPALGEPPVPSAAVTGGADPTWALGLASTCLRARAGPKAPSCGLALPLAGSVLQQSLPYLFICCIYLFIMAGERGSSSLAVPTPACPPLLHQAAVAEPPRSSAPLPHGSGTGPAPAHSRPSRLSPSPSLQQ